MSPGYYVGGKTGTAEKVIGGRYSKTKLLTDFMAILPADKPQYLILIMLDEPQPTPETHGYATAGWNAGADGGQGDRAGRAAARSGAAFRPAQGRPVDPGQGDRKPVTAFACRNCGNKISP